MDEAGIDQWLDFDMYSENGWVEQSIEQFAASQEQNKGLLEISFPETRRWNLYSTLYNNSTTRRWK